MIHVTPNQKITVYDSRAVGWTVSARPTEVLSVVVSGSVVVTSDGRRWSGETGELLGRKRSSLHVQAYQDGDEKKIMRLGLVAKAERILTAKSADIARLSEDGLMRLALVVDELQGAT
jgi:hypothetical protein